MSISLIARESWLPVPKKLLTGLGVKPAVMLAELCNEYEYHRIQRNLAEDGSFFSTVDNVQSNTGLSDKEQRACVNVLKEKGILDTFLKGSPPVRAFLLHEDEIDRILGENSNLPKSQNSNLPKSQTNNNVITTNTNIYNSREDDINNEWRYINNKFLTHYGYTLTGYTREKFFMYLEDAGFRAVLFALETAIDRKVKAPVQYIYGILENLIRSGVHDDASFNKYKEGQKQIRETTDYDNSEDRVNRIAKLIALEEQGKERQNDH